MKKFWAILVLFTAAAVSGWGAELRISILGDSYSTFKGAIPAGNSIWYPNKRADVTQVEECWWHLVITELNAKLEKNESWSGSTVCHTGYRGRNAGWFSFEARTGRLGNPDLILICGATNDSWANSPIGEYKWSAWTAQDLFYFRPALAKMLADIKTLYPDAKVFFILNDKLKPVINDSVHEICKYYHVPCIDLQNIDKQSGHPSVKGMRQIADQVLKAIR